MIEEDQHQDQKQDKPNHTELKSAGDNNSDENAVTYTAVVETTADHDDKMNEIDDIANQSDTVAVAVANQSDTVAVAVAVANQSDTVAVAVANHSDTVSVAVSNQSVDTQVAIEKDEQLENGEEHQFVSPARTGRGSGNGGDKYDDAEEVLVPKMESELILMATGEHEAVERSQQALDEVHEEMEEVKTLENHKSFLLEPNSGVEDESGSEDDQAAFMKELEAFHKERCLEFKPPRFYGEPLNCLKLWRSVIRLGGYEQVTSCKYWRQVGESFSPPKTCTTVSWTFRCFYEKALLEYEKYKSSIGELPFTDVSSAEPLSGAKQISINQTPGSGRARRDAAARAMQGWHSQRLGNGEVGDPVIKDKTSSTTVKREKQSIGLLKRKKPSSVERAVKIARMKASKPQVDSTVVDIGPPADWVKINVQRTKDCFEVYALVPGLLREEVRVQSDPVGRLVISGQPEQLDNPWGISPFKKVVSLPSRIDPHQTSAVVTLHGQLFVRVPFEQPAM